jgi:lipopolysaccharide 1,2-glucosyltransferase/general stress protein
MLTSLFYNNPDTVFHVYWLTSGLNRQSRENIKTIADKFGQSIEIIEIRDKIIKELPITNARALPVETYLRFFGLNEIPENVDRILNFDCDMIIRSSIHDLWSTDLGDNILGMVENPTSNEKIGERLGYPASIFGYYNAGMVLINLDLWRKQNISNLLFQWIESNKEKMRLYEQDAINAILYNKIYKLSIRWNVYPECFSCPKKLVKSYQEELSMFISNPPTIHYVGSIKPWHVECKHPFKREYDKYLAMTPYANQTKKHFFHSKREMYLSNLKIWLKKVLRR